jgi:hypothetical protein
VAQNAAATNAERSALAADTSGATSNGERPSSPINVTVPETRSAAAGGVRERSLAV